MVWWYDVAVGWCSGMIGILDGMLKGWWVDGMICCDSGMMQWSNGIIGWYDGVMM